MGGLWLRVSHEVAVKLLLRPASSETWKGLGEPPPVTRLLGGALSFSWAIGCKSQFFFTWVCPQGSHLSVLKTRQMTFPEQDEIQG